MSISPSKKDAHITIQKRVDRQDAAGQPLNEWVDVVSLWTWHKHLNGRVGIKDGVVTAVNGDSWRCDWFDLYSHGVEAGMRIKTEVGVFGITRIQMEPMKHIDLISEEDGSHA